MASAYPRVDSSAKSSVRNPRKCTDLPNLAVPDGLELPDLPSRRIAHEFAPGYTLTTHLVPASNPRYSYQEPRKYNTSSAEILNDPGSAPQEARERASENKDALLQRRHLLHRARENGVLPELPSVDAGPQLWIVLNRYARTSWKDSRDFGLTVIACHANGLHKETWEPTFKHIIELSNQRTTGICIDEIWSIDFANAGDSAIVNRGKLGDVCDWLDNVRDVLNFVENYLPTAEYDPSALPPPTHLERVPTPIAMSRVNNGVRGRHLVGLGHSIGGCVLANAACVRSNLFLSLTLVDPVITPDHPNIQNLVLGALIRRQTWPSREEAKNILQKKPFFSPWHPDVLDLYVSHGMYERKDGQIWLKMDRFQEATTFADPYVRQETWDLLPTLNERVKLRWIMAGTNILNTADVINQLVWRREANSTNVIVENSGHLIAQEAPYELAIETVFGWRVMMAETQDPVWARLKL